MFALHPVTDGDHDDDDDDYVDATGCAEAYMNAEDGVFATESGFSGRQLLVLRENREKLPKRK